MKIFKSIHNFHIPVMGVAFTIDSPIRVGQYGIDSVIAIGDDDLIEKMTAYYAQKFNKNYQPISNKQDDFRAKRITNYLNLVYDIVNEKLETFKNEIIHSKSKLDYLLALLPTKSTLKEQLKNFLKKGDENLQEFKKVLDNYLFPGNIDVNIMTKLDKDNFKKGVQLPVEYNDAHAALRGFANSIVQSSVVFSAGMNPRLFSYIESFDQFYPNENGSFKKKIILKVSDFRSALIQGYFLAKKGLWVSEFRIESGLNCGGHAFATEGYLLGPILEEFKTKKEEYYSNAFSFFKSALETKNKIIPKAPLDLKITVQGGVGTAEEHQVLLEYYQVDSVGWGSPFLLVPEATAVDVETRKLLANANESDLYLSNISPLGIPFNTIKGTSNEFYKNRRIDAGKAGSSCPKKHLALSKEYDIEGTCSASKKYQDIKLKELTQIQPEISDFEYNKRFLKITEKSCLCIGLSNSSLKELDIPIKGQAQGVVVCPGPNLAYFTREMSLKELVQHIYGTQQLELNKNRPNMFIKELSLYVSYFKNQLMEIELASKQQLKKWETFRSNLLEGIQYYVDVFSNLNLFPNEKIKNLNELFNYRKQINEIEIQAE